MQALSAERISKRSAAAPGGIQDQPASFPKGLHGEILAKFQFIVRWPGRNLLSASRNEAEKAAEALRININSEAPRISVHGASFSQIAEHYTARELEGDQENARAPKAHSTIEANRRYLKRWILPRWRTTPIKEMEPMVIEDWLSDLGKKPYKLANGTRLKIRNIMSAVFRHGVRFGFLPRDEHANPMK